MKDSSSRKGSRTKGHPKNFVEKINLETMKLFATRISTISTSGRFAALRTLVNAGGTPNTARELMRAPRNRECALAYEARGRIIGRIDPKARQALPPMGNAHIPRGAAFYRSIYM